MFRFAFPWAFFLLPLVVVVGWVLVRRRSRWDARLQLPRAGQRVKLGGSAWLRLDGVLPWLRVLTVVLLVSALARPQSGAREETVSTHGVDIVVALDTSGSMRAEDFQPLNRLAVAKRTVAEFIEGRPSDRIGLVAFAAITTTRCPLTLDHAMLAHFLGAVDFAPQEEDGTAMGMGLATAVNRLRSSNARSKVVVLVTDGVNNQGQIGPRAAAAAAKAMGVRVYTAGVGTDEEVPYPVGRGYRYVRIELDEDLLKEIAEETGGQFFRATDPEGLRAAFRAIDELERTKIESRVRVLYSELFVWFLVPAAVLFAFEGILNATRLRRIP